MSVFAALGRLFRRLSRRNPNQTGDARTGRIPRSILAPTANRRTRRLAERNARARYAGPAAGEPYAAYQIQALSSRLSAIFRNSPNLRHARIAHIDAEHVLADATNQLPVVNARTEQRIARGGGIDAATQDADQAARWTSRSRAEEERRNAEDAVTRARQDEVTALRHLQTIEGETLDQLVDVASSGLVPINAYLAAFNNALAGEGVSGVGVLGEEMVQQLVREAVRPITFDEPADTEVAPTPLRAAEDPAA